MTTLYGPDGFAYSNGDLATNSGGNWATLSGFGGLTISSQKVVTNGASDGAVRLAAWAGSTVSQWAKLTYTGPNGAAQFCGPTVLSDGTSTFYLVDIWQSNSVPPSIHIYKVASGSFSDLGGFNVTLVTGDVVMIDATYNGSTQTVINAYVNDLVTPVLTKTDASSPITSGRPGMRMYSSSSASLDDFSAGDFSAGGAVIPVFMNQYRQRRN